MRMFRTLWSQILFSVDLLPDHARRWVKSGCCEGAGSAAWSSVVRLRLSWGARVDIQVSRRPYDNECYEHYLDAI